MIRVGVVEALVSGAIAGAVPGLTVEDVGTVPIAMNTLPAVLSVPGVLPQMVLPSPMMIVGVLEAMFAFCNVMLPFLVVTLLPAATARFCSDVVTKIAAVPAVIVPIVRVPVLVATVFVAVSLRLPTVAVPRVTEPAAIVSLFVILTAPVVPVVTLIVIGPVLPVLNPADVVPTLAPFVVRLTVWALAW